MKFELEEYHQNTPDEELLADLRKVTSQLCKETITIKEYDKSGK